MSHRKRMEYLMATMGRGTREEESQDRNVSDVSDDEPSQREVEYYDNPRRLSPNSRTQDPGRKKRASASRKIRSARVTQVAQRREALRDQVFSQARQTLP